MAKRFVAFMVLMLVCVRVVATTDHAVCSHEQSQDTSATQTVMDHADCMNEMTDVVVEKSSDNADCCGSDCQCSMHLTHSPVFLPAFGVELSAMISSSQRAPLTASLSDSPVSPHFRPPRHI